MDVAVYEENSNRWILQYGKASQAQDLCATITGMKFAQRKRQRSVRHGTVSDFGSGG
ncbi:MAG: hypothetical protein HFI32_09180 [Lachnospiraceae bacterium]|jgi:hypothetical protein|nr:hypothetical protein [Lachnospiraceae bacterium]